MVLSAEERKARIAIMREVAKRCYNKDQFTKRGRGGKGWACGKKIPGAKLFKGRKGAVFYTLPGGRSRYVNKKIRARYYNLFRD